VLCVLITYLNNVECRAYGGGGRGETYTGFRCGNLKETEHLGDPGVDGRIILRWIFRK